MSDRIIFQRDNWRIIERPDQDYDLESLKGDVFNPKYLKEMHAIGMTLELLKQQEQDFEAQVERDGIFGYVLEKWNPEIDKGWEHVDSCWGFVGPYSDRKGDEAFKHYIVDELKSQIKE